MSEPIKLTSLGMGGVIQAIQGHMLKNAEPKQRDQNAKTVTIFVTRDYSNEEIEVECEIDNYEAGGEGAAPDEKMGATVSIGLCWKVASNESIDLTPTELEEAENKAVDQIEAAAELRRIERAEGEAGDY